MTGFILETFATGATGDDLDTLSARAAGAVAAVDADGDPIRLLRSYFVPADELCLLVFEAGSLRAVEQAATLAGLRIGRVVEALVHHGQTPDSEDDL
ncbi:MAG: hypothetical protein ACKVUT_17645 [Gaiella sp.]